MLAAASMFASIFAIIYAFSCWQQPLHMTMAISTSHSQKLEV